MVFAIAAAAAFAFSVAADVYDIDRTLKVVDRGLALEANGWLVGPKPTHKALYLRDGLVHAAIFALIVASYFVALPGVAGGALVAPVVMGIKNIHGGKVNAGVLAGGPVPDPYKGPARSAWWKFLHNW